jgi:hypothetical protein
MGVSSLFCCLVSGQQAGYSTSIDHTKIVIFMELSKNGSVKSDFLQLCIFQANNTASTAICQHF